MQHSLTRFSVAAAASRGWRVPAAVASHAQSRTASNLNVQVAGQLWQLVVVHDELPLHLAALKDYFLLSKGDFYQAFLLEVGACPHDTSRQLCLLCCLPTCLMLLHSDVPLPALATSAPTAANPRLVYLLDRHTDWAEYRWRTSLTMHALLPCAVHRMLLSAAAGPPTLVCCLVAC